MLVLITLSVLILHTIFSLQKNKFLGFIFPILTTVVLLMTLLGTCATDEKYIILNNENVESYEDVQLFEERIQDLIDNDERFQSIIPEDSNVLTYVFGIIELVILIIEFIIYGIGRILKEVRL